LSVIGRLVEQKGHRYLFEAVRQLKGNFKIKLLVIGDGPLLQSQKLAVSRSSTLRDSVIFTGLRKDVPRLLQATDLLVLPSLREGLPMVALEAMASSIPIVATNVGGMPEVIEDRVTGLLVEPEDPASLAEGLRTMLHDRAFARRLGESGYRVGKERFAVETMVKANEKLYGECQNKR
jgi:glycosyltransferase involved in cell wall biosynthesis